MDLQNTRAEIEKIAKHMGVVYSCKLLDDIVDAVQMKAMKAAKGAEVAYSLQVPTVTKQVYRKGNEYMDAETETLSLEEFQGNKKQETDNCSQPLHILSHFSVHYLQHD